MKIHISLCYVVLEELKAFWAYAQEKIPEFVREFLVGYERNSSSTNHEDQATKDQETSKGTEDHITVEDLKQIDLANYEMF